MKTIHMRDGTRRAVADVCNLLLARHGIVLTFDDVFVMSDFIDRELRIVASQAMTPEERKAFIESMPTVECDA